MKMRSSGVLACLVAGLGVSLAGCISAPTEGEETGIRIGDETLKQFQVGVTTESWLLAILGPPTSSAVVQGVENTRVYRYASGASSSGLASLFWGASSKNSAVTYFVITDGIVTRFWSDRATQYTMTGKPVEQPGGEVQK